jgi:flagellin
MRINHNISALRANNQLSRTNKLLDSSLGKLSSGYRINKAADDSAGMAISEKMRTQIAGLDQASRNASDGISVIQTAEGALIEVEAMLQRMRELSVQAANGTYTTKDRESIQTEINQLKDEIQRISETTEFNKMTLLDGKVDRKSYSDTSEVALVSLSDAVSVGDYKIKIEQDARQAVVVGKKADFGDPAVSSAERKIQASETGTITINGQEVKVEEGDTIDEVFEKIRNACDTVDVNVAAVSDTTTMDIKKFPEMAGYSSAPIADGTSLVFVSKGYGSHEKVEVFCSNEDLAGLLGLSTTMTTASGIDAKASVVTNTADPASRFGNTSTVIIKGNKVTVSDRNDFKMIFEIDPGTAQTTFDDFTIVDMEKPDDPVTDSANYVDVTVSVLDAGPMDLQIGANAGQTMSVRIPKVNPKTLEIDKVNVCYDKGAQEAITVLDTAINEVSSIRSKLGAYQNRLEHSISNLDVTSENMTESLSRIKDVDMAEEMANYTQKNVLAQAGTAMLAQANQRPQTILSLIQQ